MQEITGSVVTENEWGRCCMVSEAQGGRGLPGSRSTGSEYLYCKGNWVPIPGSDIDSDRKFVLEVEVGLWPKQNSL